MKLRQTSTGQPRSQGPLSLGTRLSTGLYPPQLRHIVVCVFYCATFELVVLHCTSSVNSRIVTLIFIIFKFLRTAVPVHTPKP